ncbi:thioredoxin [Prochlorothrix hollandica]
MSNPDPGGEQLATHSRGNHGGIAPTKIGESAQVK